MQSARRCPDRHKSSLISVTVHLSHDWLYCSLAHLSRMLVEAIQIEPIHSIVANIYKMFIVTAVWSVWYKLVQPMYSNRCCSSIFTNVHRDDSTVAGVTLLEHSRHRQMDNSAQCLVLLCSLHQFLVRSLKCCTLFAWSFEWHTLQTITGDKSNTAIW